MNMHGSQSTASIHTATCWESDLAPLLYLLVKLVSSKQFCVALRRAHTLNYFCILPFVLRFTVMFPPKSCGKASTCPTTYCIMRIIHRHVPRVPRNKSPLSTQTTSLCTFTGLAHSEHPAYYPLFAEIVYKRSISSCRRV